MDKNSLINSILLEWASRSSNALCCQPYSESDLEVLCEVVKELCGGSVDPVEFVNEISMIAEKGKHPERQAWNKNGILVTFPTPEYKARALAKGTHFEKNPKAGQTNLFGGGQQAPQAAAPEQQPSSSPMDAGGSALPQSDSGEEQTPPAAKEVPEPGTPGGKVPSAPAPSSASAPSVETPAQGQLATEPIQQPTTPANVSPAPPAPQPPPVQKTPQEIAAEKEVVKQIMNTDDTLPTVPGVGGSGMAESLKEELSRLTRVAIEMKLNEAVRFLSNHL